MYVRVIEKKSSRDRNTGSIEKRARKRERERERGFIINRDE
jgi:hypothetical protein